jgi:ribosome biogenesis SPOUT family RNA methylase Rps3
MVYVNRTDQTNCNKTEKNVASVVEASSEAHTISILDLMKQRNVPLERVCLLDPKAPKPLNPQDGEGEFDWFLFGVRINTFSNQGPNRILGYPRLAI